MQTLDRYIHLRGRFHRSVHLAKDAASDEARSGYLPSPRAKALAERLLTQLQDKNGTRAWSIIGPYGTGKSVFTLWLMGILAGSSKSIKGTPKRPFLTVPVVGHRGALEPALREALAMALEDQLEKRGRALAKKLRKGTLSVVEGYDRAAALASDSGRGGLALLVDEFGKFLEFAALHPDQDDLFAMQELAEAASRSATPFLLLTILHTQVDAYLPRGEQARLAEWRKLAGRFTDVPFLEPDIQMIRLIGSAIEE